MENKNNRSVAYSPVVIVAKLKVDRIVFGFQITIMPACFSSKLQNTAIRISNTFPVEYRIAFIFPRQAGIQLTSGFRFFSAQSVRYRLISVW